MCDAMSRFKDKGVCVDLYLWRDGEMPRRDLVCYVVLL